MYSDHKALICDMVLRYKPKPAIKRVVYDYSRADIQCLLDTLRNARLLDIVQEESHDVSTAWMKWKDTFHSVVDSFIPKRTTKRLPTPPYITKDLLHAIKRKESLRRKAKKKNTPDLWEHFRKERQRIKCWIKKKKNYMAELSQSISINSKPFWKLFKRKSCTSSLPDIMSFGEEKLISPTDKAKAFNTYFASVFNNSSYSSPDNDTSITSFFSETLERVVVSETYVKIFLCNILESNLLVRIKFQLDLLRSVLGNCSFSICFVSDIFR